MRRFWLLALAAAAACGGHGQTAPVSPEKTGQAASRTKLVPPPASAPSAASTLPPAPVADSVLDRELLEELRLAQDSAADEAVLEKLAEARPDSNDSDVPLPDDALPSGPTGARALTGSGVTFDIEVEKFNSHDRVQYYLDFFRTTGRERMAIWLSRMPHYETMIRRRLLTAGLPGDLVYLALIESGFSNTATSSARAVGMWQFMRGTARLYGLRVDRWVDERRDPYRATDAAARHLRDLNQQFGSYYLAAAAYNAGAGKVSRSLVRLPEDDADSVPSDATFFRLYDTKLLRRETKDYVPKLIAAAMIAKEPAKYGFPAAAAADTLPPYDTLTVTELTGLDVVARLADTTIAAIRELNPQYLRLVTPPDVTSLVRVPPGRGESTALAYAELPASRRESFHDHVAHSGETVASVARHYGVPAADIAAANPRLRGRTLRAGQHIIVPTAGPLPVEMARLLSAPEPPEAEYHRVRRGETIGLIATRYGVTQHQLIGWNRLGKGGRIRAGQRLRVGPSITASAAAKRSKSHTKAMAARHHHVVRPGETLKGLARRYGVSVQALRAANNLSGGATIKSGTRLRIPA